MSQGNIKLLDTEKADEIFLPAVAILFSSSNEAKKLHFVNVNTATHLFTSHNRIRINGIILCSATIIVHEKVQPQRGNIIYQKDATKDSVTIWRVVLIESLAKVNAKDCIMFHIYLVEIGEISQFEYNGRYNFGVVN